MDLPAFLEDCYACYNRREFIGTDPLAIVHEYDDRREQEVVGLIAASLAYGNVAAIMGSVRDVLARLDGHPHQFLTAGAESDIVGALSGFRYRFTGAEELTVLLHGMRRMLMQRGSLNAGFVAHQSAGDRNVADALGGFVEELTGSAVGLPHLAPSPRRGSACKRLMLFLRWMVRKDEVDLGLWRGVSPALLLVPLDVHMLRVCRALGLTRRRNASLRVALKVTEAFGKIRPDDPVKYDFALTRLSMLRGEGAPDYVRQVAESLRTGPTE